MALWLILNEVWKSKMEIPDQYYPSLRELLASIEGCLEQGWSQSKLLTRRSLRDFDSELAVLRLAEHLFGLGLAPMNADANKGALSVPDIYAENLIRAGRARVPTDLKAVLVPDEIDQQQPGFQIAHPTGTDERPLAVCRRNAHAAPGGVLR